MFCFSAVLLIGGPVPPPRPKPPTMNDATRTIQLPKILSQTKSLRELRFNLRIGGIHRTRPIAPPVKSPPLATGYRPAGMVRR